MGNRADTQTARTLTRADVCAEFGFSPAHLSRLQAANLIPFFKVGRLVRFSRDELKEWCRAGGTKHAEATGPVRRGRHRNPTDLLQWELELKELRNDDGQ